MWFRLGILLAVSVLVASCASVPRGDENNIKMCSSSPVETLFKFFEGIADGFSGRDKARAMTRNDSITGVFGKGDERLGAEIIRQIAASPEMKNKGGSCACRVIFPLIDTSDPHVKIALVKRDEATDDDLFKYKRHFSVQFEPRGNCILGVEAVEPKWEPD